MSKYDKLIFVVLLAASALIIDTLMHVNDKRIIDKRERVPCQWCDGKGVKEYTEEDLFILKETKGGVYPCPMCGGSGKLILEKSKTKKNEM